jgi:colanic acid biosynthesis glycosyl transferase WcaI
MMKEKLFKEARIKNISNIKFLNLQPYDKLSSFLNLADIHLVIQKKAAADLVMPSKLGGILSVGGLAIVTAEIQSNLYKVLKENAIAILIEPENEIILIKTIRDQLENTNNEIRNRAREYAEQQLGIDKILLRLEEFLHKVA